MSADFDTTSGVLSSAVATSGTFTSGYPSAGRLGAYRSGKIHRIVTGGKSYVAPTDFTVAFTSASVITITWLAANTLPALASWRLQLDRGGIRSPTDLVNDNVALLAGVRVNLGAPATAVATGVTTAQLLGSATNFVIDGTLAVGGVATLDVPRNVTLTVATTDHSAKTITVYGTDEYGAVVVEAITGPNANTVQGKKAFKTITRVATSAALATNGVSVGFGDILGLPIYAQGVVKEWEDGAAPSAGTVVAGLAPLTKSTSTTADVRGTYDPNSACNGAKVFELDLLVPDPAFKGNPQYAG